MSPLCRVELKFAEGTSFVNSVDSVNSIKSVINY